MVVVIVAAVFVLLVINIVIAQKFDDVAKLKGYDEKIHSYAMCFWLGIIGYLYVIALPDLNNHKMKEPGFEDQQNQQI